MQLGALPASLEARGAHQALRRLLGLDLFSAYVCRHRGVPGFAGSGTILALEYFERSCHLNGVLVNLNVYWCDIDGFRTIEPRGVPFNITRNFILFYSYFYFYFYLF